MRLPRYYMKQAVSCDMGGGDQQQTLRGTSAMITRTALGQAQESLGRYIAIVDTERYIATVDTGRCNAVRA